MRRLAALAIGIALASLPFLLYGSGGHAHEPHADHEPRNGGLLFMLGDYHLELVTGSERVALHLSDDRRRPLRPTSAILSTLDGNEIPLVWRRQRMVTELPAGARPSRYRLTTPDGSSLELPAPR